MPLPSFDNPWSNNQVRDNFNGAQRPPRRDPLTLDLDNDGLETVAASSTNPILFDHDGDGIKTGTGWVKSDDGLLVMDRNGNATIDNGTELFGDSTSLYAGGKAADGFAALAQEDTNGDGKVNSTDANWNQLRVWRDLNQDGISQAGELFTLNQAGIASFSVSKTANSQTLANGNQIADLGSYTRTDGTIGTMGDVGTMADVNLADDTFYREFPDHIALAEGVADLPEMQGSGKVRDLHEATSQSTTLKDLLAQYSQATTRQAQRALMDGLLGAWADTSGMIKTLQERSASYGSYLVSYQAFGTQKMSDYYDYNSGLLPVVKPEWTNLVSQWEKKLHILEAFNGRYFFTLPNEVQAGPSSTIGIAYGGAGGGGGGGNSVIAGPTPITITFSQDQVNLLNQAYDALTESVYAGLVIQTRFAPVLDQIELKIDANGIKFDFSKVYQYFQAQVAQNAATGLADLIEFNRYAGNMLSNTGWDGYTTMESYIRTLPMTPELQSLYTEFGVLTADQSNAAIQGSVKRDIIVAGDADDSINARDGNDMLFGGKGNDTLYGDTGNDLMDGGAGNDNLTGGNGADTYLFGKGSGQDTINNYDSDAASSNIDTIQLKTGIGVNDVRVTRSGEDLLIRIKSTDDTLRVLAYFTQEGSSSYAVDAIRFSDGTSWDIAAVKAQVQLATSANDTLFGYATADMLSGEDGNDILYGRDGMDTLDGGSSADTLLGENGADLLKGGAGGDTLYGGNDNDDLQGQDGNDNLFGDAGNDKLDGGAGNDNLTGGNGADVYLFGKGSGQDTVNNYDSDAAGVNADAIQLGAGIGVNDVVLTRSGDDLVIAMKGVDDTLRVSSYFNQDGAGAYAVETIKFADGTAWDVATVKSKVQISTASSNSLYGYATNDTLTGNSGADMLYGRDGADTLDGGSGADTLLGENGADLLKGGAGGDTLYGGNDNDDLQGQDGNDNLLGDAGNDKLDGGAGNDNLTGGNGADVYLFGKGSGQDTVNNYDSDVIGVNADTIQLGTGIGVNDVVVTRSGDDLLIAIKGADDTLRVSSYFNQDGAAAYVVEAIKFTDGTTWNVATVKSKVQISTADSDSLYGYATNDTLTGNSGADMLYGRDGADTLDGGADADNLYGENGADLLKGGAGGDVLSGGNDNDNLQGQDGSDNLSGDAGNDTLDGGVGNDYLSGGNGADKYLFGKGSGQDTVYNYDSDAININADTIQLGAGIGINDVALTRSGDDLLIAIKGVDDTLRVSSYFNQDGASAYTVESIKFADGTAWSVATVKTKVKVSTPDSDLLYGYATADALAGDYGNDTLYGRDGADTLDGGAGADSLSGENGADFLKGGTGSDVLYGGNDNDSLQGQDGSDTLYGDAGNDTLDGGVGNDYLNGGNGADTYLFGKGAGQDTIYNYDGDAVGVNADTIQLGAGIGINDVMLTRSGDDLLVAIKGTDDTMRVSYYFNQDGAGAYAVETIKFADGTTWNVATVKSKVQISTANSDSLYGYATNDTLSGNDGSDTLYGRDGADTLDGGAGSDSLSGENGADLLKGGAGGDVLYGGNDNDNLQGQDGSDNLSGDAGNDTLDGGAGTDYLNGGNGTDAYLFGKGSGQDTINNYDSDAVGVNADTIVLGAGIGVNDVLLTRAGDDLVIAIKSTGDTLRISSYFYQDGASAYVVETIKFADGASWNVATVKSKLSIAAPPAGTTKYGTALAEALVGGAGDDGLYSYAGNDTLDGGAGNDMLDGGAGNDTYLFGIGSGKDTVSNYDSTAGKVDTIQLGAGIIAANVALTREGDTLVLSIKGTADTLRVSNYFISDASGGYQVEQIKFADGTVWDVAQVKSMVTVASSNDDTLYGYAGADTLAGLDGYDIISGKDGNDTLDGGAGVDTLYGDSGNDSILGGTQDDALNGGNGADILLGQDGNDTLSGDADNDTLDGGAGGDMLIGGAGNDTYLFGIGSGKDTISSYDGTIDKVDTIQLGANIVATNVALSRVGDTLILSIKDTSDTLRVSNYFINDASAGYQVEQIKFADGTIWDIATVKSLVTSGTIDSDTLYGYAGADTLNGLDGEDTMYGKDGNDTLDGGAGADTLYGDTGNDSILGGAQNDALNGGNGADILLGQDGNDTLSGDADNDTLDGGAGGDMLIGGPGNDTYLFGIGSGKDTISSYDSAVGKVDTIQLGANIVATNVALSRVGDTLILSIKDTSDTLRVSNYFINDASAGYQVEQIKFADGTIWDIAKVKSIVTVASSNDDTLYGYAGTDALAGLDGYDTMYGKDGNDTLDGGAGADTLYGDNGNDSILGGTQNDALNGGNGADILLGQDGNDTLSGDADDDTLDGGAGSDMLIGGAGNDTYLFGIGSGKDTISNYDGTVGKVDTIQLGANITAANIALTRESDALVLSIKGTSNTLRVSNYFINDASVGYQVEQIKFADGTVWDIAKIKSLVTAAGNSEDTLYGYASADTLTGLDGDDLIYGRDGNDTIDGSAGTDTLYGDAGDDSILGGAQDDALNGGNGADILLGQDGNDTLSGDADNDTLDGGAGSDMLVGGAGNDIYLFGIGSGKDTISSYDGAVGKVDTIQLGANITAANIALTRESDVLVLSIKGTSDTLRVNNYFANDASAGYQVEQIKFTDGTSWNIAAIKALLTVAGDGDDTLYGYASDDTLAGLGGEDTIYGRDGNDAVDGGAGADILYGDAGNDRLIGGAGNDLLTGGIGNDTYVFGKDAGQDTVNNYDVTVGRNDVIEIASGVLPSDVTLSRSGDHLIVKLTGTTDTMTVNYFFNAEGTGGYRMDQIKFADGTSWDYAQIKSQLFKGSELADNISGFSSDDMIFGQAGADSLYGLDGGDTLDGGDGADSLYGGAGNDRMIGGWDNDYLDGGAGNDTYVFGKGSGMDKITNYDATAGRVDTIEFTSGVLPSDVTLSRSGNNLVAKINGTTDTLTMNYFFTGDATGAYRIDQMKFADGTVWDFAWILNEVFKGSAAADSITGLSGNEVIHGQANSDVLYGVDGNDLLNGGTDSDTLDGGVGNDFLIGGAGNDSIVTGAGYDVIAFNRGDGQDTISSSAEKDNTLSLGKGIQYADLLFTKSGNDLTLVTGTNEQVTFKNWYASASSHSVATLQMVIEGTTDYAPASANAINNKKVEQFNFDGLVTAFDQARTANPSLTSWALSSSLLNFYLSSSDTAAIGGDLAYQYAKNGSLSNISMTPAQALLASAQFGTANQNLQAASALQDSSPKLM